MSQLRGNDKAVAADEGLAGGSDALLAVVSEGNVSAASVLAAQRPFRLAVADDEDAWCRHGCLLGPFGAW